MRTQVAVNAIAKAVTHASTEAGSAIAMRWKPNMLAHFAILDVAVSGGICTAAIIAAPARLPNEMRMRGQWAFMGLAD